MKKNQKYIAALLTAAAVSGLSASALQADVTISEGVYTLTGDQTLDGDVYIEAGATLEIANEYKFSNNFYGTGTIERSVTTDFNYFTSTHAKCFDNFEGTLKINGGLFYFQTNDLSENVTISLNGGTIRNHTHSYTLKNDIIIDSTSGGVRPGWGKQSLTLSGKISNGAADTLKIISDTNTGSNASWVVLTNPENDYSNTVVDHYLRVTATGALGTGTVTINSGKMLDLMSTELTASRLANSGTVTSTSTGNPAILKMDKEVGGTVTGNIQMQIDGGLDLTNANYTHTGGTIIRNTTSDINYSNYGTSLGNGTVTLDGGILMNKDFSLAMHQDIVIAEAGASIRSGYASMPNSVGVSGNISGTGKLTFNKGEGNAAVIYLAGTNTYSGGTAFGNSGGTNRLIIDTNDAFGTGTVDISGKTVNFMFNTGGTWGRTLYRGSFNTADARSIGQFRLNMDDTANTNSNSAWGGTNRTYGYSTVIQAEEDVTLEFGKHFDDSVAIFVTDLNTGEKTTVMNKVGDWTIKTYADFTFKKDTPYLIDIRLGQGSGGVGVSVRNDGTNPNLYGLNDDPNDLVGCGVRVKDSGDKFIRLTVAANGDWAFADGSIKTVAFDREIKNDLAIGTQTVNFENTGMGNATVSGKISGTGTLAFKNTSLLDDSTNGLSIFNGAPKSDADKFNVTVAANTNFTGNGTISGNLTMAENSTLVIDQAQDLGALTINGKLTGTNISIDALLEDPSSLFTISADSVDLTGSTLNLSYTGDLAILDMVPTFTIIETENGITGFDSLDVNLDMLGQSVVFGSMFLENGNLLVSLGNSNSLPEPSTWALLLSAIAGIGFLRRKK